MSFVDEQRAVGDPELRSFLTIQDDFFGLGAKQIRVTGTLHSGAEKMVACFELRVTWKSKAIAVCSSLELGTRAFFLFESRSNNPIPTASFGLIKGYIGSLEHIIDIRYIWCDRYGSNR